MGEMEADDSWSLIAVLKECARKSELRALADSHESSQTTSTTSIVPEFDHLETNHSYFSQYSACNQVVPESNSVGFMLPSISGAATSAAPAADDNRQIRDELRDLYKPFLLPPPPPPLSTAKAEPVVEASGNLLVDQYSQQQLHLRDFQIIPEQSSSSAVPVSVNHDHRLQKKKKLEDRRMVSVTLEDLSGYDKWAWRKYGQKPIKGSPYPRNYYRCSSTKGCKARKQVERSPVDPIIYIVTYTGHHHHPCPPIRNSGGHRVKASGSKSDPPPEKKYPSGAEPVPVKLEYSYEEHGEDGGGRAGDHESLGSGVMEEGYNDHDILIPNSDLLSGMEQLSDKGKNKSFTTSNQYKGNVGFGEILLHSRGCDPIVKMEVQLNGNGLAYGLGIREMYASSPATLAGAHEPPSNMVQNIWDNGMIRPQAFLF